MAGIAVTCIAMSLSVVEEKDNNGGGDDVDSDSSISRVDVDVVDQQQHRETATTDNNVCHCPCLPPITMAELQQHTEPEDCWVAFYGIVYDLTDYAPTHTMGEASADLIYNLCGQAGTLIFEAFHPPSYLTMFVSNYTVGNLVLLEEEDNESESATTPQPTNSLTFLPSMPTLGDRIDLPAANTTEGMALADALAQRRSVRTYVSEEEGGDGGLTVEEISQLFWAAQGETHSGYKRTAPSAGALYPLEVYVVTTSGVYHYHPDGHYLTVVLADDLRSDLAEAALSQGFIGDAPSVFVFTAMYARTESKYGETRAVRYAQMEAGHAAQNLLLQAVGLGLAATPVGAFDDDEVKTVLDLPQDHEPLYVIPVGRPEPEE